MAGVPLWMVERGEARVWIFGVTVGLRDDGWLTEQIRDAVIHSRVLWCEADREQVERSPSLAARVVSDIPLRSRLSATQQAELEAVAASTGADLALLDALHPWAAAQLLEQAMRTRAGLDAGLDMEATLTPLAVAAGVPVQYEFGDAETTLAWFSEMDRELGVDYLMWTIERVADGRAVMERQVAAWQVGDLSVAEEQDAEMRRDHPVLYERMLIARNAAWVPRIEEMLEDAGSSFVLVGGGHLVGADSVLALLRPAGIEPHRVA